MKNYLLPIAILTLVGCGGTPSNTNQTANGSAPTATNQAPAPTETINVTADELVKGYKENELAGDQKFKDKNLIVTGKIESIESGIADMPYIMLKAGGDMEFNKPQAHFNKEDTAMLAKLKKGQAIKLQCIGNGEIGGMPMLKDCKVI